MQKGTKHLKKSRDKISKSLRELGPRTEKTKRAIGKANKLVWKRRKLKLTTMDENKSI